MSDAPVRIDVLGGGNVGAGLAVRWQAARHAVRVVGRDDVIAAEADVVLLAIPAGVDVDVAGARAAQLAGRVVVDATNDVGGAIRDLAGAIAAAAPAAHVTEALSTPSSPGSTTRSTPTRAWRTWLGAATASRRARSPSGSSRTPGSARSLASC